MGQLINIRGSILNSMTKFLNSGIVIMIVMLAVTSIVQNLFISSVYALTRQFNCVTKIGDSAMAQ